MLGFKMRKRWRVNLIGVTLLGLALASGCASPQPAAQGSSYPPATTPRTTPAQTIPTTTVPKTTAPTTTPTISVSNGIAKSGDTVLVDYTLKLDDGTVVDSSVGKTPFQCTLGSGDVIPGFNNAILGMKVGESKTVVLPPDLAYGQRSDALVATISRSQMGPGGNPTVGQTLIVNHQDGTTGKVTVIAVTDTTVTVDGNNPLAGKTLTFDIKLLSITPTK